ncbi:MAG: TrkA family potassium uptake protein [Caldisericota bacterium]|nr:TrkA family potassium uptake protein [Caldisericota bacterium]
MKKQFGVIGLGKFGAAVATHLEELGCTVIALDKDPDLVDDIKDEVSFAEVVEAANPEALAATGIKNCDVVVVAIGEVQSNILVSLVLEELGITNIIAKASSEVHGRVLKKIGVKEVVFPEKDMGTRVANKITSSNILDYISIAKEFDIIEFEVSKKLLKKSLKELSLRNRFGITVIAIKKGSEIIVSPNAEEKIFEGDSLFLVGKTSDIGKFEREFSK